MLITAYSLSMDKEEKVIDIASSFEVDWEMGPTKICYLYVDESIGDEVIAELRENEIKYKITPD